MQSLRQVLEALMARHRINGAPISVNKLATESNVPQSTLHRIMSDDVTEVREKNLIKLAKFFDVTVEQLRGERPLNSTAANSPEYSGSEDQIRQEVELLTLYRTSNAAGRAAIDMVAKSIAAAHPSSGGPSAKKKGR